MGIPEAPCIPLCWNDGARELMVLVVEKCAVSFALPRDFPARVGSALCCHLLLPQPLNLRRSKTRYLETRASLERQANAGSSQSSFRQTVTACPGAFQS